MPDQGARAMFICSIAERFGCPPHEVEEWPASTMRTLQIDALMREQQRKNTKNG